ncbi:MAG: YafY family transcriptional regulator [Pseudooceanicola sp.]|nr:YafY family transcriptional regulator [Pseudooceanicola sp.]
MRKMARLFEIVQIFAAARGVVTAAELADRLEVDKRTIYRDIAALQAMRVPVEGERGIGYLLRPGFTLPPMMFSLDETEALVVALGLLARDGDPTLAASARAVEEKIAASVPPPLRRLLGDRALHVWGAPRAPAPGLDLALARRAIREETGLTLAYRDAEGTETRRVVLPLALIYYDEAVNLVAWCEMRQAIRHFRTERVLDAQASGTSFRGRGEGLRRQWQAGWTGTT